MPSKHTAPLGRSAKSKVPLHASCNEHSALVFYTAMCTEAYKDYYKTTQDIHNTLAAQGCTRN